MSYAAFGVDAAVATPDPCIVGGGVRNEGGYCDLRWGTEWVDPGQNANFATRTITKCTQVAGSALSPLTKRCECPPGTTRPPDLSVPYVSWKNECVPTPWFPNCVDMNGVRVPNCFMGREASPMLYAAAVGAAVGGLIVLGASYLKSR